MSPASPATPVSLQSLEFPVYTTPLVSLMIPDTHPGSMSASWTDSESLLLLPASPQCRESSPSFSFAGVFMPGVSCPVSEGVVWVLQLQCRCHSNLACPDSPTAITIHPGVKVVRGLCMILCYVQCTVSPVIFLYKSITFWPCNVNSLWEPCFTFKCLFVLGIVRV